MNKGAATGLKLSGLCVVCILLVVLAHMAVRSTLERHVLRSEIDILNELVPEKPVGTFRALDRASGGKSAIRGYYPIGVSRESPESYIVLLEGKGMAGPLKLAVHCTPEGEILGVRIEKTEEYPGRGKEVEFLEYMRKFIGTGDARPIPLRKSDLPREEADAVSGATITFRGVAQTLEKASAFVKNGRHER
ncbi:MAG: FMN-binding protein [Spirochaetales bacterium]|jgi:electron transport complex protein RnfG|nr:FMN-binding protein [Spirochaetales bacterium]